MTTQPLPQSSDPAILIQPATADDVPALVALSESKRTQYAAYQPQFWRKAADSAAAQTPYFHELLARENVLVYAAVEQTVSAADAIVGFVIAALVPAPAVYDPGGLTCLIDDFCVAQPTQWATVGRDLLTTVTRQAARRGAAQVVVVCGHLDEPKRAALRAAGLTIASEWYVGPVAAQPPTPNAQT
jgi:GNAT superfamily N-acetyltransferase